MKNYRKRGLNLRNWLITASAGLIGYLPLSQKVEAISRKPTLDGNTLVYESEEEWRNESPDFTLDKRVNFADFLEFVNAYGSNNERYDLNGNGKVDFEDFLEFVECFGRDIRIEEPQIPPLQKIADQSVEQVDAVVNPKKVNLGEAVPQELKQRGVDYALSGNVRGLKVSLEDSILTYRPFGTFNSEDNGDAYVEFTVTPKNSDKSQKGEVKVAVRKNDRAMQHDQETIPVTGVERWPDANNDGLVEDADTIFIYAGNALNPGDPDDIRLATGPKPTKEQVGYAIEDFKRRSDITSGAFFENPNIVVITNPDSALGRIYHPEKEAVYKPNKGTIVFFWDNSLLDIIAGLTNTYTKNGIIEAALIRVKSNSPRRTYAHEILGHSIGIDHPESFTPDETIFHENVNGNSKAYTILDKFTAIARIDN